MRERMSLMVVGLTTELKASTKSIFSCCLYFRDNNRSLKHLITQSKFLFDTTKVFTANSILLWVGTKDHVLLQRKALNSSVIAAH